MVAASQVPCPYCQHQSSLVLLTQRTRRRRKCQKCHRRFTTYEKVADHLYQNKEATSVATQLTPVVPRLP